MLWPSLTGTLFRDCSHWPWNPHPSMVCMESWCSVRPMVAKHRNGFLLNVRGAPLLSGKAGCRVIHNQESVHQPWYTHSPPRVYGRPYRHIRTHFPLSRCTIPSPEEECPPPPATYTHTTAPTHAKALLSLDCNIWWASGSTAQLSATSPASSSRWNLLRSLISFPPSNTIFCLPGSYISSYKSPLSLGNYL